MMKQFRLIFLFGYVLFLGLQSNLSSGERDHSATASAIYWKTLSLEAKKAFLYAYLYRTHEIGLMLKESGKDYKVQEFYSKVIAEPFYEIYSGLEVGKKEEIVSYIDRFYRMEFNLDKPFFEALKYAYSMVKVGEKTLTELVEEYIRNLEK